MSDECSSLARVELVADTPDRLDVAGADRIGLDLLAQASDVDGHGAGVADEVVVPDLVEELLAAEDLTGVAGQEVEEVELLGGQVDRAVADLDRARLRVDLEAAVAALVARLRRGAAG